MKPIEDTRNLQDEYKGLSNEQVFDALEQKRNSLEVAIENVEHDFNAGTIVRSANNFNVVEDQHLRGQEIVAIENHTERARPLSEKHFTENTTLLFGSEGDGLTEMAIAAADDVREIESFGSTRSVNVGVAAGIAMYEWARQCVLK